ncbi:MAG: hypothetical protein K2W96_07685 [Gemmataceae bacterium]|nr:hypothetical protein [Gemmataceae bacterium]
MYPVFLDLTGKAALVVGFGPVGRRKAEGLLAAGARVRVVALEECVDERVEWVRGEFAEEHLDGMALCIACVDEAVNARIVAAARARGILVCDAADGARGDFHVPAVARIGCIELAVGTGGRAPGVAARLRDALAAQVGPEWVEEALHDD